MAYLNKNKDNNMNKGKPGIYGLEYAIMLLVITTALVTGYALVRQSVAGRMRNAADSLGGGMQYQPSGEHKTNIAEVDSVCLSNCQTDCEIQAASECSYSTCGTGTGDPSCCATANNFAAGCTSQGDTACAEWEHQACSMTCDNNPRCACPGRGECSGSTPCNCNDATCNYNYQSRIGCCQKQCWLCGEPYGISGCPSNIWQNAYNACMIGVARNYTYCCTPKRTAPCVTQCRPTCYKNLN